MEQPRRLLHCLLPGQTGICHHELRIKKEAEDFLCLLKLHCEGTFLFRVSGFSRALTLHRFSSSASARATRSLTLSVDSGQTNVERS